MFISKLSAGDIEKEQNPPPCSKSRRNPALSPSFQEKHDGCILIARQVAFAPIRIRAVSLTLKA